MKPVTNPNSADNERERAPARHADLSSVDDDEQPAALQRPDPTLTVSSAADLPAGMFAGLTAPKSTTPTADQVLAFSRIWVTGWFVLMTCWYLPAMLFLVKTLDDFQRLITTWPALLTMGGSGAVLTVNVARGAGKIFKSLGGALDN